MSMPDDNQRSRTPGITLLRGLIHRFAVSLAAIFLYQPRVQATTDPPRLAGIADSTLYPWRAIGRINIAGFRTLQSCTGTLIGPRQVVTAAHCLFDPRTGADKPVHPGRIHFLAGLRVGGFEAHGLVACVRVAAGYRTKKSASHADRINDLAVIVLRKPLAIRPVDIAQTGSISPGSALTLAGYARHRGQVLTVRHDCKVPRQTGPVLAVRCDAVKGQSGGPVLLRQDGQLKIAAIIAARGRNGHTLAVRIAGRGNLATIECGGEM